MAGRSGWCSWRKGVTIFAVIDAVLCGVQLMWLMVVYAAVEAQKYPEKKSHLLTGCFQVNPSNTKLVNLNHSVTPGSKITTPDIAVAFLVCGIQILLAIYLALRATKKNLEVPDVWFRGTIILFIWQMVSYVQVARGTGGTVTFEELFPALVIVSYKLFEIITVCCISDEIGDGDEENPKLHELETEKV